VNSQASRPSAIIRIAVERQDLAPVAIRGVDRVLDVGKAASDELRACRSGGQRNFNADARFRAMFAMGGEQDRVAHVVGDTQP
jgi:hypothetical protein